MSGIQLTTENANLASIVDEIKASQQKVLKAFEEHNIFVNKSLQFLQQLKTETKVEVVKVKDPLEEIKKIEKEFDEECKKYDNEENRKVYESQNLKVELLYPDKKLYFFNSIIDILCLYEDKKISSSFKEIFLKIFNISLPVNKFYEVDKLDIPATTSLLSNLRKLNLNSIFHFENHITPAEINKVKKRVLKVRDIRWLLLEMEKYPQIFQFTEVDLIILKENDASRDNIYLVKKFLKKDGDYEEYYPEEEGGGIKLQYHMTGGVLNGEYKEYYEDGSKKAIRNYKDGELDGITETWYKNGKRSVYASFNKGLMHGVYNSWYENENPMYESQHQNNIRQGTRIDYYYNGQKTMIRNYIDGLQVGEYKYWAEGGALLKDIIYDNKGKLINLKQYHSSGFLDLEKTLIENDTYELSRYYESTGKLHYKVMMRDGKWNGEYISYWNSGKICTKTTYKNDKLDGEWEYWNENGTLKEKIIYKDGEKQV